ncbi:hypothetical protein TPHA_0C00690 [Tetrapisispora phaffii CBS 4417]|uniref:Uncharacterized protein n=1 Tax=Tetrapisispora phaffii (strain ATCC 24235 / CBS 4417 / NBRC 1672 / NRRL Y-8282 / UCD 70-5) TaxID=1071381 RepID=G8BR49_TETPH|nr:hypothetical protein TPHA_0C00690 [Tetrapisispora phaffii CBS 4417]CCE62225.1 hypothetical protein TPHA_0C00690 [Tetrapisispora phaffii CBS 4417]
MIIKNIRRTLISRPLIDSQLSLSKKLYNRLHNVCYYSTIIDNEILQKEEGEEKNSEPKQEKDELEWEDNEITSSLERKVRKLQPNKANFVVLNPKQAGLLKQRKIPNYFNTLNSNSKISILEGVDIDKPFMRMNKDDVTDIQSINNETNREIESQTRKLLVFKSKVSDEQILKSINYQKPYSNKMSQKRYDQIEQVLDSAYTLPQLRAYTKKYYNFGNSRITKKKLIKTILNEYWKCEIVSSIIESDDLIKEKIIDISTRDMYLLLLTNNGKILQNLTRIGAILAVALDENKIIVRATSPIIKYLEVSLNKILSNVSNEIIPVNEIIKNHTSYGAKLITYEKTKDLISLIQKETGCFFEKQYEDALDDKSNDNTEKNVKDYLVSSLGPKRITEAKNLLLWVIDYKPQLSESVQNVSNPSMVYKQYPFSNFECLDWMNRNKKWYRLQTETLILPKGKTEYSEKNHHPKQILSISNEKLNDCFNSIKDNKENSMGMANLEIPDSNIFNNISLTLGHLLREKNNDKNYFFEPKVPNITKEVLKLELDHAITPSDSFYNIDQHDYYVQLKFVPNLKDLAQYVGISKLDLPPLDLWFELDENDNALTDTLQSFLRLSEKRLYLESSNLHHDYRIDNDRVASITKQYDENPDGWLNDQPGIKEFITNGNLSFGSKGKLVIPQTLPVTLIVSTEDGIKKVDVNYEFISTSYHRILKLRYLDKYLVQLSHVNSGTRGGRYTQVDFIGDGTELDNITKFKDFIENVSKWY